MTSAVRNRDNSVENAVSDAVMADLYKPESAHDLHRHYARLREFGPVAATSEDPIVSQIFDLNTLTWTAVGGPQVDGGSTAMYRPGKFLKVGTSTDPDDITRPSQTTSVSHPSTGRPSA